MKVPPQNKNSFNKLIPNLIVELLISVKQTIRVKKLVKAVKYENGFLYQQNGVLTIPPIRYVPSELKEQTYNYFLWNYIPKKNDIIFDIGSGMGTELPTYSELVGEKGVIFSFEPHAKSAAISRKMIDINKLNNVKLFELATSNMKGQLNLSDDPDSLGINSTINQELLSGPVITVNSITLDDFVEENEIKKIDFLKMNIEGGEVSALYGFNKHLKLVQNLVISCHDFIADFEGGGEEMRTKEKIKEILLNAGFKIIYRSDNETNDPAVRDMVYATRR